MGGAVLLVYWYPYVWDVKFCNFGLKICYQIRQLKNVYAFCFNLKLVALTSATSFPLNLQSISSGIQARAFQKSSRDFDSLTKKINKFFISNFLKTFGNTDLERHDKS